jgi:FlaA1/EpsC-like NDP-sugar epimerase
MLDRNENGLFFLERELRARAPNVELQFKIADASDYHCMKRLFETQQPDIVFHAAAYKHVPLMESNVCEAVKNIVLATRQLADLANEFDVGSFVMISTDKAVNPTSVMGACKRVAETYVQALTESSTCQYVTVRFGNVLDSAGSVVPIFREQIAQGGPVTVTHPDMQRYFMMIPEASQLVIQAGAMGQGGEVFVLDMGDPVRIFDLACEMISLSGLEVGRDIEIHFTGMRPGEKLFEELHIYGESHVPTIHPKIMVATSTRVSHESIDNAVDRLGCLAKQGSGSVVNELQRIVPQYCPTPKNSGPPMKRAA